MANITVRSGCLAVAVDLQGNIAMVGTEEKVMVNLRHKILLEISFLFPGVGGAARGKFPARHLSPWLRRTARPG